MKAAGYFIWRDGSRGATAIKLSGDHDKPSVGARLVGSGSHALAVHPLNDEEMSLSFDELAAKYPFRGARNGTREEGRSAPICEEALSGEQGGLQGAGGGSQCEDASAAEELAGAIQGDSSVHGLWGERSDSSGVRSSRSEDEALRHRQRGQERIEFHERDPRSGEVRHAMRELPQAQNFSGEGGGRLASATTPAPATTSPFSRSFRDGKAFLQEALLHLARAEQEPDLAHALIAEAHRLAGNGTAALATARYVTSKAAERANA